MQRAQFLCDTPESFTNDTVNLSDGAFILAFEMSALRTVSRDRWHRGELQFFGIAFEKKAAR
jgi:hypothetical protein